MLSGTAAQREDAAKAVDGASPDEVRDAEEEGITLLPGRGPRAILGTGGRVTALETLDVDETDTVSFPSWTAQPCSTLSIACFTSPASL